MQTLTHQVYRANPPGGVFDHTLLRNLFPDRSEGALRLLLHRAAGKGEILRLTPGLFVLAPEYRRLEPHPFAVAAILHSPSHISLESALAHHGLIPEAVYQVSSVTAQRSRSFTTPLGIFPYRRVPMEAPLAGVKAVRVGDGFWACVATPLRALADLLYLRREITWKGHGLAFLAESLRIEPGDLTEHVTPQSRELLQHLPTRRVRAFMQALMDVLVS